jgi:hypothetical protein
MQTKVKDANDAKFVWAVPSISWSTGRGSRLSFAALAERAYANNRELSCPLRRGGVWADGVG